jgi:hypothetical protein
VGPACVAGKEADVVARAVVGSDSARAEHQTNGWMNKKRQVGQSSYVAFISHAEC